MFITPARCKEVAFSEPSYGIGQAFLVKEGNPQSLKDYAPIAENEDLKLAVMAGAVEVGYAKKAGVGMSQLVVLPDQSSLVKARSDEHTSELQSPMRNWDAAFC